MNNPDSIRFHSKIEKERKPKRNFQSFLKKYFRCKNVYFQVFIAELFGTFIFVTFGCSSIAQYKLFNRVHQGWETFLTISTGMGFGLMIAILVAGKVSGGHYNPAVSFAMLLTGQLNAIKFLIYVTAQFLGAFLAGAMVFVLYYDSMIQFGLKMYSIETAGIFGTYPVKELSVWGAFFDQFLGTLFFVIGVLAVTDKNNVDMPHGAVALIIGLLLFLVGISFGYNTGFAVNPARDFGPRVFSALAGWGSQVFSSGNYFFWIPIVAPMIGSFGATILYSILISNHF
ncbi:unnamed protein product [Brachionus calyciflorus]|uniref:Aquaporin n=1 Tax=Brachionus calyciflorus TaxID=104777 RepID=A0A813YMH7_9BILA|nr:unnamed protein product [Brachionus calyciflorus]